jgi:transcription elongation factor Elf1
VHIKEKTSQHRRDFTAIYKCEHCDHEQTGDGYDDAYFHKNVIPTLVCDQCGMKGGEKYEPLATKYPEGYTV